MKKLECLLQVPTCALPNILHPCSIQPSLMPFSRSIHPNTHIHIHPQPSPPQWETLAQAEYIVYKSKRGTAERDKRTVKSGGREEEEYERKDRKQKPEREREAAVLNIALFFSPDCLIVCPRLSIFPLSPLSYSPYPNYLHPSGPAGPEGQWEKTWLAVAPNTGRPRLIGCSLWTLLGFTGLLQKFLVKFLAIFRDSVRLLLHPYCNFNKLICNSQIGRF